MPTRAHVANPKDLFHPQVVYQIPPFQRRYAWNKERQWRPLWEDICSIADRLITGPANVCPHFMGAIVLQETDNPNEILIIDGQQRITTLQLIIKATQRAFANNGLPHDIQPLIVNECGHLKVKCQPADQGYFELVMTDGLDNRLQINPIGSAAKYFQNELLNWTNNEGTIPNRLNHLKAAISEFLDVVVITLGREEQPNQVFETLNSRAEPLLQSDLVRSTIMFEAVRSNCLDSVKATWGFFEDDWWRQVSNGRLHIDIFLHCWVAMKKRRFGDLARVAAGFSEIIDDETERHEDNGPLISSIIDDLVRAGKIYRKIERRRYPQLKVLRELHPGHILMPFLLRMYDLITDTEVQNSIVKALESYVVRHFLVRQGFQLGNLNQRPEFFLSLIESIQGNADAPLGRFRESLRNGVDAGFLVDVGLHNLFPKFPVPGAKKHRIVILEAIEKKLRDGNQLEGLEYHDIMPRDWGSRPDSWPIPNELNGVARDDRAAARDTRVLTIGNMTLVHVGQFNNDNRAGAWDTKRPMFGLGIRLNEGLGDHDEWDTEQIECRSAWLAECITDTWPIPY